MTFLAPYFLLGLLGLSVPILIHLWSKNTRKSVQFGSIRFLQGTETKTMRSVAPSQWVLLLTRLVLVTLFVFLMSKLLFEKQAPNPTKVFYLDPEYASEPWIQEFVDTTKSEVNWLVPGFLEIDEEVQPQNIDHWSLISQIPNRGDEVVVVSPMLLKNFNGERRLFSDELRFLTIPSSPREDNVTTYTKGNEGFEVLGTFSDRQTRYEERESSQGKAINITYDIVGDNQVLNSVFESAISTIDELTPLTIEKSDQDPDWLISTSGQIPNRREKVVFVQSGQIEKWKSYDSKTISVPKNLSNRDALEINLPGKLLHLFARDMVDISDFDQLKIDESEFEFGPIELKRDEQLNAGFNHWLWLIFVTFLIAERWLSFKSEKK